jgi:hypothetical protein
MWSLCRSICRHGYLNLRECNVIAIQECREFCEERPRMSSKSIFARRAADESNDTL